MTVEGLFCVSCNRQAIAEPAPDQPRSYELQVCACGSLQFVNAPLSPWPFPLAAKDRRFLKSAGISVR